MNKNADFLGLMSKTKKSLKLETFFKFDDVLAIIYSVFMFPL